MVARFVIPAALLSRNPAFSFLAASTPWIPANRHALRAQLRMKRLYDGIFTGKTCRNDAGDVHNHCAQNK
jgi:hypothetical protein